MGIDGSSRFLESFGFLFPAKEWAPAKLESLLSSMRLREMEAGTVILREGQVCGAIPFVIEGSIRVFKRAESGREISLYRIESGQSCILSAGCSIPGLGPEGGARAFPANVVAEKDSLAAFLPSEAVQRLFAEGPSFRAFVLEQYSRRMAEVIELVEEVAFRKVDERLRQFLGERASGSGLVSATHQELADQVGTSREVVSRILKDWEDRGALELSRGSIRLLPGFRAIM